MLKLPSVTLVSVDTTARANLAARAIQKSMEIAEFGAVKLLTNDTELPHAVKIEPLKGLEAYSDFMVRDLGHYVQTPHALVVQWDGYATHAKGWRDEFLKYDYIGAPWLPSCVVGNGGFSLRSKRLLDFFANYSQRDTHPEDAFLCVKMRGALEKSGMLFAPPPVAGQFSFEGRSWNQVEWSGVPTHWNGQFGFHSWLTKLPAGVDRPKVFHHTGDYGDIIYSLPVIKALGGGVLFLSADNRYPYPMHTRAVRTSSFTADWVDNIKPLLLEQDYIWNAIYTIGLPYSTDCDLNKFREPWKKRTIRDFDSILSLHQRAFGTKHNEAAPWLKVSNPFSIPSRPIVVNRTQRYQDNGFSWYELVQRYGDQMVFVGDRLEAEIFQGFSAPKAIPHQPTKDMLGMARVIAGAKVVIANQSSALAIAHGLGKRVIVEEWSGNSNCRLNRPGAIYSRAVRDFEPVIPKAWLE